MSFKIVGKKTTPVSGTQQEAEGVKFLPGSDEKPTLQLKYMNCTKSAFKKKRTL